MKIKEITSFLESWAPRSLQETYDNSGLIMGDPSDEVKSALITLDVTEAVVDEAVQSGCDLIIAHHPLIFRGIKQIGRQHWIDKCIRKAIRNDIAIYAIHTNLDNINTGVNRRIAEKIGMVDLRVLSPKPATLSKLSVFVPSQNKEELMNGLFNAGAGNVGNYDRCSFQSEGTGTFRGNESSNPSIGVQGKDERVEETRIEVLAPKHLENQILRAMKEHHPYEEVAYYLSELKNVNQEIGAGLIGSLEKETSANEFLAHLKHAMNVDTIKHTSVTSAKVRKIAVCGGSGSFLLPKAIQFGADMFISADFKYHDYFEANGEITIVDIGHYESEVYTKDLLHDELTKTFTKFAFRLSKVDTNPIKYL